MKILVCVKQVPDTTEIRIDPETNTLIRAGVPSIMNPFDEYAVEQALRLKEQTKGQVTVLTMGPVQAREVLEHGLAMGADEACLLTDRRFGGSDTLATSYILAAAVKKLGPFDVIFCGKQAIDGDTGQVGPELAEHLGIAQITYGSDVTLKDGRLEVTREYAHRQEILSVSPPVLITVTKGKREPRFETIWGRLRANHSEILVIDREQLTLEERSIGLNGSPTRVKCTFTPERHSECIWIEGDGARQKASELLGLLTKAGVV